MPRLSGFPKTGGRIKGTPNRSTFHLIEMLEELQFDPVRELVQLIPNLPPERRAGILLELMSFIYPKRKPSESLEELEDTSYNFSSEREPNPERERIVREAREILFQKLKEKIEAEKSGNDFLAISTFK